MRAAYDRDTLTAWMSDRAWRFRMSHTNLAPGAVRTLLPPTPPSASNHSC
jgi:hypothetical protein